MWERTVSLLDEQIVDEWLNRQGFFTMRGIKIGRQEIDFLAVRHTDAGLERWHVEVQASFRPIGYLGGDNNARKRSPDEIKLGVQQYVEKKFKSEVKNKRRLETKMGSEWQFVLVHAVLKGHDTVTSCLNESGVKTISYDQVLMDLIADDKTSSSIANDILEIMRFVKPAISGAAP